MPRVSLTTSRPRHRLRLAPGIELRADSASASPLLIVMAGEVRLNAHACAILTLCDGSRSRGQVVIDAVMRAGGAMRASDVREFLEAAESRGWLIDAPAD
jgi:pyrroloquinoline quinone biosynthesis protein D